MIQNSYEHKTNTVSWASVVLREKKEGWRFVERKTDRQNEGRSDMLVEIYASCLQINCEMRSGELCT